jgi:hypothetical protein
MKRGIFKRDVKEVSYQLPQQVGDSGVNQGCNPTPISDQAGLCEQHITSSISIKLLICNIVT